MKIQKYILELVVFFCGGVVMAYEIIGSRILGPYVGTSMFVWSSIIGIILLSLSMGYYYGGRVADRHPESKWLAVIIGGAGAYILLSLSYKNALLDFLSQAIGNVQMNAIISSFLMFAAPAVLLGMVSPFAARLKIRSTRSAGATVGNLYALSTVGSISGTFLAGFYLIPSFRLTLIMVILGMTLLLLAFLLYFSKYTQLSYSMNHETDKAK